jgi:hypothetical protein
MRGQISTGVGHLFWENLRTSEVRLKWDGRSMLLVVGDVTLDREALVVTLSILRIKKTIFGWGPKTRFVAENWMDLNLFKNRKTMVLIFLCKRPIFARILLLVGQTHRRPNLGICVSPPPVACQEPLPSPPGGVGFREEWPELGEVAGAAAPRRRSSR